MLNILDRTVRTCWQYRLRIDDLGFSQRRQYRLPGPSSGHRCPLESRHDERILKTSAGMSERKRGRNCEGSPGLVCTKTLPNRSTWEGVAKSCNIPIIEMMNLLGSRNLLSTLSLKEMVEKENEM